MNIVQRTFLSYSYEKQMFVYFRALKEERYELLAMLGPYVKQSIKDKYKNK